MIEAALAVGDFRQATAAVYAIASEANKYISQTEPWRLVKAERAGDAQAGAQLDAVLAALIETCRELAGYLGPFLPKRRPGSRLSALRRAALPLLAGSSGQPRSLHA